MKILLKISIAIQYLRRSYYSWINNIDDEVDYQ